MKDLAPSDLRDIVPAIQPEPAFAWTEFAALALVMMVLVLTAVYAFRTVRRLRNRNRKSNSVSRKLRKICRKLNSKSQNQRSPSLEPYWTITLETLMENGIITQEVHTLESIRHQMTNHDPSLPSALFNVVEAMIQHLDACRYAPGKPLPLPNATLANWMETLYSTLYGS
jgi:hypothetical protein